MRILIVEDDYLVRQYLFTMLSHYGEVRIASNGSEAMDNVADGIHAGEYYDLICLDIIMPELDGIEVLKNIRKLEKENGERDIHPAKVVMMTGIAERERVLQSLQNGCDAFLVKPIEKNIFFGKLAELGFAFVS